jgi:hypothetical protein
MNSKNNLILRYIEGDMEDKERTLFETELRNSIPLQKELSRCRAVYDEFSTYKDINAGGDYFMNMVPIFKSNLQEKIKRFPLPKIAWGSAVLMVAGMFLFLLLNRNTNDSNISQTLNENELTELLNNYSSDYLPAEMPGDALVDSTINALYLNELNVTTEAESYYFADRKSDIPAIVMDINDKEADNIYKEIINKKYF